MSRSVNLCSLLTCHFGRLVQCATYLSQISQGCAGMCHKMMLRLWMSGTPSACPHWQLAPEISRYRNLDCLSSLEPCISTLKAQPGIKFTSGEAELVGALYRHSFQQNSYGCSLSEAAASAPIGGEELPATGVM